ncbi:MAG: T9SS type A sorting domain-containing protein [Bacteroidota bacterium]|nr:T9SS type A sorting domain-containing protein [Bacteroidota bacterium]
MKKLFYSAIFLIIATYALGQHPFLEEVYDEIKFTPDLVYGENATVLYFQFVHEAIKEPLLFDLYEPIDNNACLLRPLIIYFHSGNFLPVCLNRTTVGTRRDSSVVEICRRLARSGYVVASADYRQGWNAATTIELEARIGLINAAYRGVQDANTSIRYFKKSVAEDGNPFRIDTSSIVLFGDDSGGYLSLHAACLDDYDKLLNTTLGQFVVPPGYPMIFEEVSGDVEGKNPGIMDTINFPVPWLPFPHGDTLNYPNHVGYCSKFCTAVAMGSAVADTSWIDPGQPSMICAHVPYDLTTPYLCDPVYVGDLRVIDVCGCYYTAQTAMNLGNNNFDLPINKMTDFQVSVSEVAASRTDGIEGALPIYGDTISDGTPWVFWDPATHPCSDFGYVGNPHMTREKAELYIDTILAFVLPRLFSDLRSKNACIPTKFVEGAQANLLIFPNPTAHEIYVNSGKDYPMRAIQIYDLSGKLVKQYSDIGLSYYHIPIQNLSPGQYVVSIEFDQGLYAHQIVIQ